MILDESLFEEEQPKRTYTKRNFNAFDTVFDLLQTRLHTLGYRVGVEHGQLYVNRKVIKKTIDGKLTHVREFLKNEEDYKNLTDYLDDLNVEYEFRRDGGDLRLSILLDEDNANDVDLQKLRKPVGQVKRAKNESLEDDYKFYVPDYVEKAINSIKSLDVDKTIKLPVSNTVTLFVKRSDNNHYTTWLFSKEYGKHNVAENRELSAVLAGVFNVFGLKMPPESIFKQLQEDLTQDMLQDLKDQDKQYDLDKEAERETKVELAKQGIVMESVSKDKLKELADKYNCTVRTLDDKGETFWIEGEPNKREEFVKEYIELSKTLDEDIVKSIEKLDPEVQREVDFVFASNDQEFGYKMLDRLRSDNDYILGTLSDNSDDKKLTLETINKFLWFHDIDKQIDFMKGIYERLDKKPEWISEDQIEKYRSKLKDLIRSNEIKENLESFDYDKLRSELEAIPNVTKVDFDKDLIYDTHELVVLVSWHSDPYTAHEWFEDRDTVKTKAIEVFKNNGLKLSDPVEDNDSYFYFVVREITPPVDESLKEAWSTKDGFEEDESVYFQTGDWISGHKCYHTLRKKHYSDDNNEYKIVVIDYGYRQEDPNEEPYEDRETGMLVMPKTKVIYDKPKVLDTIDFTAQEHPEIENVYYSASETGGNLNKYKELILDLFEKKGEVKENLKEDLSQEEKTDYGLNTLINSLITDEYEAIDGYNSAIVTFEAEGKGEFTDVIRDIIKDEQNHIGNLQILLKEVQPDVLDNFEHGQGQAEQILDADNTSDETELTESKEDKEWYGLVNHSDMTDIDFALVSKDKEELEKHWGDLLEITEGDIGELSSEEYFNTITGPKIEELDKIGVHFVDSEGGNTAPTGEYLDINEEGKISFKDKPLNILRKSHSRF